MIWKVYTRVDRFLSKCRDDRIDAFAAQSAFFIIISLIPFLLIIVTILQYTIVSKEMLLSIVHSMMPEYIAEFIQNIIDELYERSIGAVSVTAVIATWSAAKGIQYISSGLNVINGIRESRNWFILRVWAVIYTFFFQIAIVLALVLLVFGNKIEGILREEYPFLGGVLGALINQRQIIVMVILMVFFSLLLYILPDRKMAPVKLSYFEHLPGAVLCSVAWFVFSYALSIYVNFFHGFSMYGNLTTIVLVMLWFYFCMYIFMMCAEFNVLFSQSLRQKYGRLKRLVSKK